MGLGEAAHKLAAQSLLFEEFLAREHRAGRLKLNLRPATQAMLGCLYAPLQRQSPNADDG